MSTSSPPVGRQATSSPAHRDSGFTMVELIVTISILTLLLLLLTPSLQRALESARSTVCLQHLGKAAKGVITYAGDFGQILPGPNTSGYSLGLAPGNYAADDDDMRTAPVTNCDWVSPSLGNNLALSRVRLQRLRDIFNSEMRCPTNDVHFSSMVTEGSGSMEGLTTDGLRYSSYTMAMGFAVLPPSQQGLGRVTSVALEDVLEYPGNYYPNVDRIGVSSEKILLTEGARYVQSTGSPAVYSTIAQNDGGNFMTYGPAIPQDNDPYPQADDLVNGNVPDNLERLSYRHYGNGNAAFFDGHGDTLTPAESRRTSYYFPSGTRVIDPAATMDPDDAADDILP